MKKTFNINISGYVFTIDDDAYDLLKDYLDTLHHAFASQEDGAELIADIEQRMAEILGQQNDGGMRVITIADAEAIIARMGRPEEIIEDETVEWCETILSRSPMAIRMIKRALNAELDGQRGMMEFAGDATLMYYLMEEAQEGKNAFLEKRDPDFDKFPKFPG